MRNGLVVLGLMVGAAAAAQQPANPRQQPGAATTPTVLFMCPHGAAKSVLASAYFRRAARERGLIVDVTSAGTEPDAQVSPAVAAHLERNGYDVPIATPRRVTAEDLATADIVVSLGCDLKDLPAPRGRLVKWDDVPSPSEEFERADEVIRRRAIDLVEELLRAAASRR